MQIGIYVRPRHESVWAKAKKLAVARGWSLSELVGVALDFYLANLNQYEPSPFDDAPRLDQRADQDAS